MSEYLSEEEQIARMKSWWDENGTSVIVAGVITIAAIVGWRWYANYSLEQSHDASRAYAVYQAASSADKASAFQTITENYHGSAYHAFGLFQQAQDALAEGDLVQAETHLGEVVDTADEVLLVDLAKVRLAKVQNGLDRSAQALETLTSLSNEGYRAWGLEAKGDIHVARGELELAHAAYEAATASLEAGDERPILDMKLKNVAPFAGQYVEFGDTLEAALQQAQDTLEQAGGDDVEAQAAFVNDETDGVAEAEIAQETVEDSKSGSNDD